MRLLAAVTVGLFVWAGMEALAGRTVHLKRTAGRRRRAARQVWLSQAGAAVTPAQFWAVCAATAAMTFVVLYAVDRTVIVALLPALGAGALPYGYWSFERQKRANDRFQAWPDALRLITGGLQAGIATLHEALEELSVSGPEALRPPMARYVRLVSRGISPSQALEAVRAELADPVSDPVLLTLELAAQEGTAIAVEVLSDLGTQITGDLELAERVRTEQTQSRIAAWGVFVLPYGLLVLLCSLEAFYRDFYSQAAGLAVVAVGAVMSLTGFVMVRRLVKPIAASQRVFVPDQSRTDRAVAAGAGR